MSLQWGDDWDDAPYEHNAGEPYGQHVVEGDSTRREDHDLFKIAWEGPFDTPCSSHLNSKWSVKQINAKHIAWLRPTSWCKADIPAVHAGTTLREFIDIVRQSEGEVYVPLSARSSFE
jgi:hypothetical protein